MPLVSRQFEMEKNYTQSPIQPCCNFPLDRHYLVLCNLVLDLLRGGLRRDDWLDGMDNQNLYLDVHWYTIRLGRVYYCALFLEMWEARWPHG